MADSIIAGQTGRFLGAVTASDNSVVTTSGWSWSVDDTNVTIAPDKSDASGATVIVTVPASDTATKFNLTATATAQSTTEPNAQSVTKTIPVAIAPAPAPVTFTMSITQLS